MFDQDHGLIHHPFTAKDNFRFLLFRSLRNLKEQKSKIRFCNLTFFESKWQLTSWPKLHTLAVILDLKEVYLLSQKVKRKTNTRKRQGNVYSSCHKDFIFF